MQIRIETDYLTFPVNSSSSIKKLLFYRTDNGVKKLIYDLDCKLDSRSQDFTAYVNLSRFKGMTLDIVSSPDMNFDIGRSNEFVSDLVYWEDLTPKVHFSVKNGWNNDPNGLIKYDGKYHMFYQYNPCGAEWGSMHWGHAVSCDLIHWTELETALYPDSLGAMYSGSAIEDENNVSGFGVAGKAPMLLYYTAAGGSASLLSKGKPHTQCLAYSLDGITFEKYENNPVVEHIEAGNRDPKVVYAEELGKYLMALYLDGSRYSLYQSDNLINWEFYQDISIPSDSECPDIYFLYCGEEKIWIISGASDYYIAGKFGKNGFEQIGNEKRLTYSAVNYAAQSFSGVEDGRVIRLYWQRTDIPSRRITQQMSIPVEMSLTKESGEYWLSALPIREFNSLRRRLITFSGTQITSPVTAEIGENPLDITLVLPYYSACTAELTVFGYILKIDMHDNTVAFGKNRMPLSARRDKAKLRIIVDRCSVEIFTDGGNYNMACKFVCDYNLPYLKFRASESVAPEIFEIYLLDSIHP